MQEEMMDYLKHSTDRQSLFYNRSIKNLKSNKPFSIPSFDVEEWVVYTDEHWTNLTFQAKDFPDQGWKIHITADINEASSLLYDVADYLIKEKISFKYVPNLRALESKNVKYANSSASGKFITVYPESNEVFYKLLEDLKEVTASYKLGPYILNDQQWQESNIFFRYGGLKRITSEVDGKKFLAIKKPDGTMIPDERVPYYHLPDFVEEPDFVKDNNTFPEDELFNRLKDFKIIDSIHHSNGGGVYLAELEGKKVILKEGRHKAGIDGNGNHAFQRNKNEYLNLKRLKSVEGVINVHEYFTAWRHNYFTEDYHDGKNLREFISQEFPFTNSKDKSEGYVSKCITIINQLMGIIEEIHEKGIAMGDLSLTNIMLSDDLKVTLIDFEAATAPGNSFNPGIATPGLLSSEAKNFMEADWYAFYRISRSLFLPILSVYDIAPQIINTHNKYIKLKFGEKAITFLNKIENKISKYTILQPQSPYLNKKLGIPNKELSTDNIDYIIRGLQKGILNNLDVDSFSLIKGNIKQYNDLINKYNISYGSFGVILSLIRSNGNAGDSVKNHLSGWLNLVIPYIEKESQQLGNNIGLFNGLSGMITVIYELGYEKSAKLILKNLLYNFTEEKINSTDDISIYSGLSGIGLLYLSFYNIMGGNTLLENVKIIYNRIISIYKDNINTEEYSPDFGLLTGWSGAALFLYNYSLTIDESLGKNFAFELVDKSFESVINNKENTDDLFIINEDRGFKRLIPYLENGSSGIALAMLEFYKEDKNYLNESRKKILDQLINSNYLFCSVNGGLMSGYAGFLPLANAISHLHGKTDMLDFLLKNMNNYLVKDENDEILFPGYFGLKCSMDVRTGAAGVLMILNDLKKNKWGSWLPLPQNGLKLFEF